MAIVTYQWAWTNDDLKNWFRVAHTQRIRSLAMYGDGADPRYAVIFEEEGQWVQQTASVGLDALAAVVEVGSAATTGWFPTMVVTQADADGVPMCTVIFEPTPSGLPPGAPPMLNPALFGTAALENWVGSLSNYYVLWADAYWTQSGACFSVLALPQPTERRIAWGCYDIESDLPFADIPEVRAMRRGYGRADRVTPWENGGTGATTGHVSVWRGDVYAPWPDLRADPLPEFDGGTPVDGPLLGIDALEQAVQARAADYSPLHIGGSGLLLAPAFCVTFARNEQRKPLDRIRTVRFPSQQSPGFSHPDMSTTVAHPPHSLDPRLAAIAAKRSNLGQQSPYGRDGGKDVVRYRAARPSRSQRSQTNQASTVSPIQGGATLLHGVVPEKLFQSLPGGAVPFHGAPQGPSSQTTPLASKQAQLLPDLHPLDEYVFKVMGIRGARGAQLAIGRRGKIVFSRAYTLAEEGYPLALTKNLFRIGSLSKSLTALGILSFFSPDDLASDAFGLPQLAYTGPGNPGTLGDLLRHHSGWQTEQANSAFWSAATIAPAVGEADGTRRPGDMYRYLSGLTSQQLFSSAPGTAASTAYNGEPFFAMGELVGFKSAAQRWDAYESAMVELFSLNAQPAHIVESTQRRALDRHEFPCHDEGIGWTSATVYDSGIEGRLPSQYATEPYQGPAGFWAMSAETLATIFQRLGVSTTVGPALLSEAVVRSIATPPPLDSSTPWGLGFQFFPFAYHPEDPSLTSDYNKLLIWWDGIVVGGLGAACHIFPKTGSPQAFSDNLSIAFLLNTLSPNSISASELRDIAKLVEDIEHQGWFI